MVEDTSNLHFFDFKLNKNFFWDMNKTNTFSLDGMNGVNDSDEYTLIVFSSIPADIYSCCDDEGCLLPSSKFPSGLQYMNNAPFSATVHLLCQNTANNNGITITVAEENGVSISLATPDGYKNIQGLFLINSDTRYLLAYARLSNAITINDNLILPFTGALCKIGNCR